MESESDSAAPFRVAIFTGVEPRIVRRLIDQIHRLVPEARICGVLYHKLQPLSGRERVREFMRNLRDPEYARYVAVRVGRSARTGTRWLGRVDSSSFTPISLHGIDSGLAWLNWSSTAARGVPIHVTTDVHSEDSLEFVHGLRPRTWRSCTARRF